MFFLLVGGTRSFGDYKLLKRTLNSLTFALANVEIVTGGQKLRVESWNKSSPPKYVGADYLAERWCDKWKYVYHRFQAYWREKGKKAGPMRNTSMVKFLEKKRKEGHKVGAVFFWNGKSPGTKDCLTKCKRTNIPTKVVKYV